MIKENKNMKKILIILLLFITIFSGCTIKQNESENVIEDAIGRKVNIKKGTYKRVVCIGAGALRLYSYIGDISLLCGVEDIENINLKNRPKMFDGVARPYYIAYKEVFENLPSCGVGGPMAQVAEAEKILSCNPDIVLSEYEDVDKEDALQKQLGVPVITLKYGNKGVFDDNLTKSMRLLGEIFNKQQRAESLIKYIDDVKKDIMMRTSNIKEEDKKNVYICGLGSWGTTNHLQTAKDYEPFNIANITNIVDSRLLKGNIQAIEKELFISLGKDMDIMIIDAAGIKNIIPLYQEDNTIFNTCKAWQKNEVYLQLSYNTYYTNLEIALVNTYFAAKVVYPEYFNDIDINKLLDEVTYLFLGKELANEINNYPQSYGGYQKIDINTFFN